MLGAVVLIMLGMLAQRDRLRRAVTPSVTIAIIAAAGGTVGAVRLGLSIDPTPTSAPRLVMIPVLDYSLASAALAGLAAFLLVAEARRVAPGSRLALTRFVYTLALVLMVAGPITATRLAALPIPSLWILMAALLALMIGTAFRMRHRSRPSRRPGSPFSSPGRRRSLVGASANCGSKHSRFLSGSRSSPSESSRLSIHENVGR